VQDWLLVQGNQRLMKVVCVWRLTDLQRVPEKAVKNLDESDSFKP
jgi:hypothetical protein